MHIASYRGQHITSPTVATVNRVYIRWHLVLSIVTLTSSLLLGLVYRPLIGRALGPQAPTGPTEPTQLITYTALNDDFPNPERGIYVDIDLINQTNFSTLYGQGNRVAYAYVTLMDYRTQDLPASFLQKLDAGLARIRSSGLKVVPRFSYTSSGGNAEAEPDATLDQVLRHINQIGPVLTRYADSVLAVEAGFIGAWGEWHHSSNNLHNEPARSSIFDALLAQMPASRAVLFRFPRDLVLHFPTALDSNNAFNGSAQARAGHHNDCFMADYHDSGTWIPEANAVALKSYIEQISRYIPVGGETCNDAPRGDCVTTQTELARFHWSFLDPNTPARWTNEGCLASITRLLGYRFRLVQAELPTQLAPGQSFQGWLDIVNDGYAAPANPRAVELVLRNTSTGALVALAVSTDPRRWLPGSTQRVTFNLTVPSDAVAGNYEFLLNLPDPESALRNMVQHRVRLANSGTWEAATGYNKLNANLTMSVGTGSNPTATPVVLPTQQPTVTPVPPTATPIGQPTQTPTRISPTNPPGATPTNPPTATSAAKTPTAAPTKTATPPAATAQPNRPPLANAGADVSGYFKWDMSLNGQLSSDPDGNPLSYVWTQVAGTPVQLFSSASSAPTFTVPITPGVLTFQLLVKDPAGLNSPADTVNVTVINRPPLAHAGYDRVTYPGWKVYLDGARSVDPDTHRLSGYTWQQTGGTPVQLASSSVVSPLFTAPITPGTLTFQLMVMDRFGLSSLIADTVLVTVTNRAPIAHAGYDRIAATSRDVQLDGSRSMDPDKHKLVSYRWVQDGGTPVLLSSDSVISPTFSTPKGAGALSFKLSVVDAYGLSSAIADTVLVTVTASVVAAPDSGNGALDLDYIEVADSEVPLLPELEIDPEGFEEILSSEVPFVDGVDDLTGLRNTYMPSLILSPD